VQFLIDAVLQLHPLLPHLNDAGGQLSLLLPLGLPLRACQLLKSLVDLGPHLADDVGVLTVGHNLEQHVIPEIVFYQDFERLLLVQLHGVPSQGVLLAENGIDLPGLRGWRSSQ
jgi:hypothetical protein